jgi:hypothetical protein
MSPSNHRQSTHFRRGDLVEVLSREEILSTLDAEGLLEGLPFMPEMARFCGETYRVGCHAERIFLDHYCYVARVKEAVFLEGARCDGHAHGGCQMGCLLFWKEAWLKPADTAPVGRTTLPAAKNTGGQTFLSGSKYCCQATQLVKAATRLPWWDVRQYVRDLLHGDLTLRQFAGMLPLLTFRKLQSWCGRESSLAVPGQQKQTTSHSLNLQPGELVEVKSRAEIEATLDTQGRNKGLGFADEMLHFCGRRFRVAQRVERLIIEWTGEMRKLSDTVALEDVVCQGLAMRGCPRQCCHLWREIWLKRV